MLCTDNAKTQVGEKWATTSRQHHIQQRTTVPHNQNQNYAERCIQDIKHKSMQVLYESNAPVQLWCYCLIFVTDCYNYTAKESLENKVPVEVLTGDTPDISAFRYAFWQEIDYYDPSAKFPLSPWQPGYFLGINWRSGDAFTFTVWTAGKNNDWKTGRELTRNIIRPRKHNHVKYNPEEEDQAYHDFRFQKRVTCRKRRRRQDVVRKYVDLEELYNPRNVQADPQLNNESTDQGGNDTLVSTTPTALVPILKKQKPNNIVINQCESEPEVDPKEITDSEEPVTSEEEDEGQIEMVDEINDAFSTFADEDKTIGGPKVTIITGHEWKFGNLYLRIKWDTGQETLKPLINMNLDHPVMTARYILEYQVSRTKRGGCRDL